VTTSRALALLNLAFLLLAGALFERPAPLFVNLGAGDSPFARGFRGSWERDGLTQSGDTQFRWTLDGARLEFPVEVASGHLEARVRLARFAPKPAEMTILAQKKEVDRFVQPSRGWSVRVLDLGDLRGPLTLQFRSRAEGDEMGVALDWVEVNGAGFLLPQRGLYPRLALFFFGLPLLAGVLARSLRIGLGVGCGASLLAGGAVTLDRLGGLVAVASAALPGVLLLLILAGVFSLVKRVFPETAPPSLGIPAAYAGLVLLALFHPFYYYPDVDTHAHFMAAIRAEPSLAWDPSPYQLKEGTWTRQIGGAKVAFPYSPVFHLTGLPLSLVLSDTAAVKLLGISAFGTTLLLVFTLARLLGAPQGGALLAQLLAALLPVGASRLTLALYPALLGQAAELFVALYLVRWSERRFGALFIVLCLSQLPYVGSLVNVGVFVGVLVLLEFLQGLRPGKLLIAALLAGAVVFSIFDRHFLTALFKDVLPHLGEVAGKQGLLNPTSGGILERLFYFFDAVAPILALLGAVTLLRSKVPGRSVGLGLLLAGAILFALKTLVPALFQDVKDAEFALPILSVLAASGLTTLFRSGRVGRAAALLALVEIAVFGLLGSLHAYTARFFAVGR
jgi:hypothetical protein